VMFGAWEGALMEHLRAELRVELVAAYLRGDAGVACVLLAVGAGRRRLRLVGASRETIRPRV
jgi:hypothetical protein